MTAAVRAQGGGAVPEGKRARSVGRDAAEHEESRELAPVCGLDSKFARALSSTETETREIGLRGLTVLLQTKPDMSESSLKNMWKGILFAFWHADMPPVQQDLSHRLAALLHEIQPEMAVLYFRVFLSTMFTAWGSIDRLRLDKFMMLVRHFFQEVLRLLAAHKWDPEHVATYAHELLRPGLHSHQGKESVGFSLHVADVFGPALVETLAAGGSGSGTAQPSPAVLLRLTTPFICILQQTSKKALLQRTRSMFELLVSSHSQLSCAPAAASFWGLLAEALFSAGAPRAVGQRNRRQLYELSKAAVALAPSDTAAAAEEYKELVRSDAAFAPWAGLEELEPGSNGEAEAAHEVGEGMEGVEVEGAAPVAVPDVHEAVHAAGGSQNEHKKKKRGSSGDPAAAPGLQLPKPEASADEDPAMLANEDVVGEDLSPQVLHAVQAELQGNDTFRQLQALSQATHASSDAAGEAPPAEAAEADTGQQHQTKDDAVPAVARGPKKGKKRKKQGCVIDVAPGHADQEAESAGVAADGKPGSDNGNQTRKWTEGTQSTDIAPGGAAGQAAVAQTRSNQKSAGVLGTSEVAEKHGVVRGDAVSADEGALDGTRVPDGGHEGDGQKKRRKKRGRSAEAGGQGTPGTEGAAADGSRPGEDSAPARVVRTTRGQGSDAPNASSAGLAACSPSAQGQEAGRKKKSRKQGQAVEGGSGASLEQKRGGNAGDARRAGARLSADQLLQAATQKVASSAAQDQASKRLRFDLQKNVVCLYGSPVPPKELRTPPRAQPHGSALRKLNLDAALGLHGLRAGGFAKGSRHPKHPHKRAK